MDDILEYDKNLDVVNTEVFRRNEFNNPDGIFYRCVLCKEPVTLDESFSNRGHKLICNRCARMKFNNDRSKMFGWIKNNGH